MEKKKAFRINPEKASARVSINSFMMGNLFFILTLIWTLNPEKFSIAIIGQLVLAIPLLFVSSLAYSKIGYWKETKYWDHLGWFTHNIGNSFVLNVAGLVTATVFLNLAFVYFGLTILCMLAYFLVNVIYRPYTLREQLFKFSLFMVVLFAGGIIPLLHLI